MTTKNVLKKIQIKTMRCQFLPDKDTLYRYGIR